MKEICEEAYLGEYPGEDTETLFGSNLELEEKKKCLMSTSTCVGSTGELSPNSKSWMVIALERAN